MTRSVSSRTRQWRLTSGALTAGVLLAAASPVAAQRAPQRFESGDRIRVWAGAPSDPAEGRFWGTVSAGIRIADRRGRPVVFAWERIERIQGWQPADDNRELVWMFAGLGALTVSGFFVDVGHAFEAVPDTRTALLVGGVGAVVGAWLGWMLGHVVTDGDGTWVEVPLDRLRPPP